MLRVAAAAAARARARSASALSRALLAPVPSRSYAAEPITRAAREAAGGAAPPPPAAERVTGAGQKHTFQAETKQLLNIVANSLYTDKHVFIRCVGASVVAARGLVVPFCFLLRAPPPPPSPRAPICMSGVAYPGRVKTRRQTQTPEPSAPPTALRRPPPRRSHPPAAPHTSPSPPHPQPRAPAASSSPTPRTRWRRCGT